ncbi:exopolyphosphatase [Trichloromonas sp.]|uniref:Ppx/GppA phosphatase family protein n=1 Tax=Trichloromonas sp. TaxID=3069249 RepID=UPI003D813B4A
MLAAVDVGTNTVRLLLGEVTGGRLTPVRYERSITRLGGGFQAEKGLAPESMERTLLALRGFVELLTKFNISSVRAVGTQALRQSVNGQGFVARVQAELDLPLQIIDGGEEARLSARGVAEGLFPKPERYLVFDIGGGSTEFVYCENNEILFSRSYPLGVVRLAESCHTLDEVRIEIERQLDCFTHDMSASGVSIDAKEYVLVGTAGTVTTLAAMDLEMVSYDWRKINNHRLERQKVHTLIELLLPLSPAEREQLPGMEKGRGDLIVPGLFIVSAIMRRLHQPRLAISDFGLLEGALLSLADVSNSN